MINIVPNKVQIKQLLEIIIHNNNNRKKHLQRDLYIF